jgi:hypothetical protein
VRRHLNHKSVPPALLTASLLACGLFDILSVYADAAGGFLKGARRVVVVTGQRETEGRAEVIARLQKRLCALAKERGFVERLVWLALG